MASVEYVSNLLKVSDLRREIKSKFTQQNLQDQGLKQDIIMRSQPVTESQTKTKDDIIAHLSNLSNVSNRKLDDFITSVIKVKEPESVEDDGDYEHLLLLAEAKKTEDIKNWLSVESNSDFLLDFVQKNHDINFSSNPWRQIRNADPEFYEQLRSVKKTKKGSGVKFLPSGKEELIHELFRLIGSYKSGNKNVYNELNAVVDQLRRNGTLTIEQSKRIYKIIS